MHASREMICRPTVVQYRIGAASLSTVHFDGGCEQPVQNITAAKDVRDSSLDKAGPKRAAAIEAQIDRDDASENFIKEKLHSKVR
jgi:hypothetical protein